MTLLIIHVKRGKKNRFATIINFVLTKKGSRNKRIENENKLNQILNQKEGMDRC